MKIKYEVIEMAETPSGWTAKLAPVHEAVTAGDLVLAVPDIAVPVDQIDSMPDYGINRGGFAVGRVVEITFEAKVPATV